MAITNIVSKVHVWDREGFCEAIRGCFAIFLQWNRERNGQKISWSESSKECKRFRWLQIGIYQNRRNSPYREDNQIFQASGQFSAGLDPGAECDKPGSTLGDHIGCRLSVKIHLDVLWWLLQYCLKFVDENRVGLMNTVQVQWGLLWVLTAWVKMVAASGTCG